MESAASASLPDAARDFLAGDNVDKVFYQVIGTRGELVAGVPDMPLPSDDDRPQPGLVEFRDVSLRGNDIRIAYTTVELPVTGSAAKSEGSGQSVLVQVGETFDKRSALANEIIKGVILPQFVILPLVTSFNDLLTRLAQNIDLQKRFIADAAHQMKTPLAGLHMQAELALRDDVSPEVRRSLEQIATGADQAARLVTQLLALARAENRMSGQIFTSVEVAQLARLAVRDWVRAALAKHMDLGYEGPDEPVYVDGNPVMLREMLSNVIDNAIRYTPPGGRITVRVRPLREAGQVRIEVEDTGPGIAPAERPKVIERFYRILGREGDGSGLGLAIVREIATMHGGTLTLDDHVYQTSPRLAGTLVRIDLPIAHSPRLTLR
jgi:two-component system sensor histidine kinase TctE